MKVGLQLNKTVCKTKFIKPKSPKAPKMQTFSVVFFFESTRGIVRGHREKKARACFQEKFSPISVKITDKTLNKLINFSVKEISNFSPNVHFQKERNMSSIVILVLVLGYTIVVDWITYLQRF